MTQQCEILEEDIDQTPALRKITKILETLAENQTANDAGTYIGSMELLSQVFEALGKQPERERTVSLLKARNAPCTMLKASNVYKFDRRALIDFGNSFR